MYQNRNPGDRREDILWERWLNLLQEEYSGSLVDDIISNMFQVGWDVTEKKLEDLAKEYNLPSFNNFCSSRNSFERR